MILAENAGNAEAKTIILRELCERNGHQRYFFNPEPVSPF
jgi:hypothetical protein